MFSPPYFVPKLLNFHLQQNLTAISHLNQFSQITSVSSTEKRSDLSLAQGTCGLQTKSFQVLVQNYTFVCVCVFPDLKGRVIVLSILDSQTFPVVSKFPSSGCPAALLGWTFYQVTFVTWRQHFKSTPHQFMRAIYFFPYTLEVRRQW